MVHAITPPSATRHDLARSQGFIVIVCSCTVLTDRDLEAALVEILSQPNAPLPTPGVVFRHLSKQMQCCGCAPLTVSVIYDLVDKLEREGRACPCACATAKSRLSRLDPRRGKLDPARITLAAAE